MKKYQINVFEESFTVVSDDSEKLVMDAVSYVDSLMKEISLKSAILDSKKVAILAALKIASKTLKLESELEEIKKDGERLSSLIDKCSSLST
ncbi:MAG: cell division protein ZapA [Candidatus Babeliales bacterium]|nr:cell division protein ZapA [Candidatus Babeliales bacterium]